MVNGTYYEWMLLQGDHGQHTACGGVFHVVLFNKSVYLLMFSGTLLCLQLCESQWWALKSP